MLTARPGSTWVSPDVLTMWRRRPCSAAVHRLFQSRGASTWQRGAAAAGAGPNVAGNGPEPAPSTAKAAAPRKSAGKPWERERSRPPALSPATPPEAPAPWLPPPSPGASNSKLAAVSEGVVNRRLADTAAPPNSRLQAAAAQAPREREAAPAPEAPPVAKWAAVSSGKVAGSLRDALAEHRIALSAYSPGQYRVQCPLCRGGTDGERSLAVKIVDKGDTAMWICHRGTCGWEGAVTERLPSPRASAEPGAEGKPPTLGAPAAGAAAPAAPDAPAVASSSAPARGSDVPRAEDIEPVSRHPQVAAWFQQRGISLEVVERNGVGVTRSYNPATRATVDAIVFPYRVNGAIVNAKYRQADVKSFWQSKGGDKTLYGLDDMAESDTVIIVEGEMDKLAMEQAGYRNCVSVPDGAPAKVKDGPVPPVEEDRKFSYLWQCRSHLDRAKSIILATDADEPGQALAEELARRLGRERCWRVQWPGSSAAAQAAAEGGPAAGDEAPDPAAMRKDANEVLMKDGAAALAKLVDSAHPVPIRGLFRFGDFEEELDRYFGLEQSQQDLALSLAGMSGGWDNVDQLYRIVPGELSIVTGVPNSGKSEWVDALMCNLAERHGWSFALCSMENKVTDHARKLIEKFVGKPFFSQQSYAQGSLRMSDEEYRRGKAWLDAHFALIRHEDDELPSIDWVLGLARAAVLRYGIRGLLIDPYNELDHRRPNNVSETEYVSQMLTRIKRFASHYDVHVWFVAHPRQMQQWRGGAPGLYDISGSAHFVNKCDNGIVVHRIRDDPERMAEVRIIMQKVRNKVSGRIGEAVLKYDRASGRYMDIGVPNKDSLQFMPEDAGQQTQQSTGNSSRVRR